MPTALATLSSMGKNHSAPTPPEDPHQGKQINLRVHDLRLLLAIEKFGEKTFGASLPQNRRRNSSILLLVEKALREEGLWPLGEEDVGAG